MAGAGCKIMNLMYLVDADNIVVPSQYEGVANRDVVACVFTNQGTTAVRINEFFRLLPGQSFNTCLADGCVDMSRYDLRFEAAVYVPLGSTAIVGVPVLNDVCLTLSVKQKS